MCLYMCNSEGDPKHKPSHRDRTSAMFPLPEHSFLTRSFDVFVV